MKTPVLVLTALLALAGVGSAAPPPDLVDAAQRMEQMAAAHERGDDSARLKAFFDLYWSISLLEAPDFATYVGHRELDDRWPDRSPETIALLHRIARTELAALSTIDRSRLTPAEQVDHDLARRRLETRVEGERFHDLDPFHNELLLIDTMSGVDLDLLGMLDAMPTATVRDYENRLARLRGFPTAVDQTIAWLRQGLAAGITPPKATLVATPDRVASLLADDPWQSPVLASFQKLPDTIPAPERERLRNEAARLFTTQVAPAVRRLHGFLAETYVPGARETIGMSALPDGEAWYAYRLRSHTTTSLTPEQIHRLGLDEVRRIRGEMDQLITSTGFKGSFADFSRFLRTDPRFYYDRPEDLVAGYRDIAKRIDPGLIKLFGRLPRLPYGVKPLEGTGAKTAPPGYFNAGSLAGGMPGWFLVNTYDLKSRPKWAMEALTLHEAVPGHHLQYSLVEELGELPEWRKWDVYPAFSEGWGLYAESLGSELGLYQDPYSHFGQLTNEIWRAIRLVVDTGVHAQGWTRQQAIDYYTANCSKPALDIQTEVDRIIVQPGTVPVYKLGELKILELRDFARKQLGDKFDIRAFHDQILGHGQLPLDLLEKSIHDWVSDNLSRTSKR
jgi:uncharacterized protein (DUF885 family)